MGTKEQILEQLEQHRGTALSGQALAHRLGVSRTAVWKAVRTLQDQGHSIRALPNRGYQLMPGSPALSEPGIRRWLGGTAPIEVHHSIDSTNTRARQLAAAGAPHGTLVVADHQTAGRGRRGRSFVSPPGTGLYLSVVLRSALPMEQMVLATSAAAVAVRRAVQQVCGCTLGIKWVNDLYARGKKCCGILTEASADLETGGVDYLVVGIGLNLLEPGQGWPPELQAIAGAILELGTPVDRSRLAGVVAAQLLELAEGLPDAGFMQEYRAANIVPGQQVTVLQNGSSRPARALDITDQGHLLIREADGTRQELSFGEVSIRVSEPGRQEG